MWRHSEGNDCGSVEEMLEALVDGELGAAERKRVEAHVEACGACGRQLELARAVSAQLNALPSFDAPPAVIERVLATAHLESGHPESGRDEGRHASAGHVATPTRGLLAWLPAVRPAAVGWLAAAALAAALLVVWYPGSQPGDEASTMATTAVAPAAVDEAEIRRAADEARLALAYISRASRRTGLELRDELVTEGFAHPAAVGLRVLGRSNRPEEPGRDET